MSLHQHESTTTQSITWHDTLIEAHRLVNKAQLLIRVLGGLLPGLSSEHLQQITSVLEIACGPGLWTQEMARAHPQTQVIGVDTSPVMIAFARSIVSHHHLANIHYCEIPSFVGPYPFNEAAFDLVSVQFMSKFLTADAWPHFLSTCWHLLRPGGLIRLTEYEVGLANAPAYEELSQLFLRAMRLAGRSISSSDRHLGMLCELESLLYVAGFQERSSVAHLVNCSYGMPCYEEWRSDFLLLSKEAQSLIVQTGLATQEQIDALHQRQSYEMNLPTFRVVVPMLTIWGTKR